MDFSINPNECVSNIVNTIKSNGSFDQFRRECLSDVDTKPSYRNLIQRVDICVNKFFSKQSWNPSLNKAQLRNRLRNEINDADQVRNGIHHLVDQIVNTKVRSEFKEKIEKSLKDYLGIKDPEEAPIESEESASKPGNDESAANVQEEENKNIIETQNEPLLAEKEKMELISDDDDRMSIDSSSSYGGAISSSSSVFDSESLPSLHNSEMPSPEHEALSDKENPETNDVAENAEIGPPLEENSESQTSASELCSKQYDESSLDVADASQADSASNSTSLQFAEESVETNDGSESPSKVENDQVTNTTPSETLDSTEGTSNVVKEEVGEMKELDDISDVSSVHTSDLSDFDDEISISSDDDDHKDSKKKKISLKIVKELTASISEEKKPIEVEIDESSEQAPSNKSTASSESDNDSKKQLKRKRKKNPKFESYEPVVKKLKRSDSVKKTVPEDSGKGKKQEIKEGASTRQSLKRKQADAQTEAKITNLRTRKTSLSTEVAEKTPADKRGRGRPKKVMPADQTSNKRYDSSDLYKPRNSLANTSSRRTRAAADLDSNSNSTADDL